MFKHQLAISVLCAAALSGCLATTGGGKTANDSGVATGAIAKPATGDYTAPTSEVKVEVVKPNHLNSGTVLIVPTAYVRLPVSGKVSVSEQGSALRTIGSNASANTVKASAQFAVKGLDKALAQKIAADAYNDFVAQLRASGYTVLTYADIKDRDAVKDAGRMKPDGDLGLPTEKILGGAATAVIAAPSDEQAFEGGFAGGAFNQFIRFGKTKLDDGILIIPQYTIVAPQMWGEKNSNTATIGVAIKGVPAMELTHASASWLTNKPKVEMMSGIPGVHLKGVTGLSDKVGTLLMAEDTTSGAANAVSRGLGFLSGKGSIASSSAKFEMTIDRNAYAAAAVGGARKFNTEVARIAAEQKPR
jgi:hypothetical protein